jgi:hypothetical protein
VESESGDTEEDREQEGSSSPLSPVPEGFE